MHCKFYVCTSVIFILQFASIGSSVGDTYPSYRFCVQNCRQNECKNDRSYLHSSNEFIFIQMLWNCFDNCEYECMWPMVRLCVKNKWRIPQFNGKWPFTRLFGMQEPASVAFSFLNLMSTLYMFKKFYKAIYFTSSMYWAWTGYTVVSVNTWFWSIIFHIRDLPFTERMDYIGASLLIYYTFFLFEFRILIHQHFVFKIMLICGSSFFIFQHIVYLMMTYFDYRYNFETLIFVGLFTGITTLIWCIYNWTKMPHLIYAAVYLLLTLLFSALEVFDFPPILWIFDAHSLWHLSTAPLPIILYKFAIEDCRHLRRTCRSLTIATID